MNWCMVAAWKEEKKTTLARESEGAKELFAFAHSRHANLKSAMRTRSEEKSFVNDSDRSVKISRAMLFRSEPRLVTV